MVRGVHLVAVAVALVDHAASPYAARRRGPGREVARVGAQPHGAAHVHHALLLGQQVDHRVRRGRVELRGVRAHQAAHVPGELDHRALQAQAEPQERDPAARGRTGWPRSCPPRRGRRTRRGPGSRPPPPGPRRRSPAISSSEAIQVSSTLAPWWNPPCLQRLDHREVGVLEVHVLADDGDVHRRRPPDGPGRPGLATPSDRARRPAGAAGGPGGRRGPRRAGSAGPRRSNRRRCAEITARVSTSHSSEIFSFRCRVIGPVRPAHDHVGLDTDRPKLPHGVLGRLGLQLAGRADERHQGDVDERHVLAARPRCGAGGWPPGTGRLSMSPTVPPTSTTHDVGVLGRGELADPVLDLVGDVGDDLDGLAQELAPALLGDDASGRPRPW